MKLVSLLCLVVVWAACQTTATDPIAAEEAAVHDRLNATEGGQLVLRAIDAAGGVRAWLEASTSSYTWQFGSTRSRQTANNRTRQIYHDLLETTDSVDTVYGQMAWDGTDAWVYPDSLNASPRFQTTTAYYFQFIPFVLADPGLRYEVLPDDMLDGVSHQMVKASFDDDVGDSYGDTYTLYLDPDNGLVRAIRYTVTYGRGRPDPAQLSESLMYYLDYETIGELTVPTRFETYGFYDGQKGDLRYRASSSDISFSVPFDENRLVMPEGGRVELPPTAPGEGGEE